MMSRLSALVALTLFWTSLPAAHAGPAPELPELSVDLHSHLFMSLGMGISFHGDFFEPLRATAWSDRFSSQINADSLERSGLGIVVAALYAHPIFELDMRQSVRNQIDEANRFVAAHPNWIIARRASEARAAVAQGKRVLVLSLEGASGILETEDDLREFVDRRGISIVTFVHLTDDQFGGVAFLPGSKIIASPLAFLDHLFDPEAEDGTRLNERGLSPLGAKMAQRLIDRGVWLDLTHSSDATKAGLIPLIEKAHEPLLYTHTGMRKYLHAERESTLEQFREVARTHGIVGMSPNDSVLNGAQADPRFCPKGCTAQQCQGSISMLATEYAEMSAAVGNDSLMMGTDFNGIVDHLKPSCRTGTSIDREGYWNAGQTGDVWKALRNVGAPVPASTTVTVDRFIAAWERVRK